MATILCVDDEPATGVVLEHHLTRIGHRPLLASSVEDALKTIARTPVDLIVADYRMPKATGLDLLSVLEKEGYQIPVIIMTGYSSIEHAVISIKSGAIDYLTKPIRPETLEIAVTQALEVVRLRRENEQFRREINRFRSTRALVGESPHFRRVMETISTVAPTKATVLLEGESGTGKELFARAVHDQSPRHEGPFIAINCAAMPDGLIESALFGHEKGAFTGATTRSAGAFERAHGGTLLLDEISEMRLDLQAKLLRVIQEHEFERVGGHQAIRVDVRLVATTNRDLRAEAEAGRFRTDLFYRLNVVPIKTPPLRERREDIPVLVQHFARRAAEEIGVAVNAVSPEAVDLLMRHSWPGNVRELANAVERAVILSRGGVLRPEVFQGTLDVALKPAALPPPSVTNQLGGTVAAVIPAPAGASDAFNLDELERQAIQRALVATAGNRTRAAKLLGISERTLRNKLNGRREEPATVED
ncbi:MAG: sigma-54-dependent Fis family transcriptional regulator [Gemmatimonadetes bacterium]|jgi:two-component system response regulator HydG|nr:sigma-54-dependent Fis family transcriptional regulator [Gemmatimonadota bacterium]MBP6669689.1 sigma-54-dependent Fis family transcriptional regulator [Gemmatimonadales bacterium]MBK6778274.1 sigma-54-dependent Fis family transcriptional regulator [Gemmatimonadota bacterium]MBK7349416.1 sigma-54-dependent Fis family transcriptional regulator [Gemmatimonadota bacterium]MBK7716428.1 sigma-54-dependent Fis family transcriptional regulator [Gemmatimonadota bacterium]